MVFGINNLPFPSFYSKNSAIITLKKSKIKIKNQEQEQNKQKRIEYQQE